MITLVKTEMNAVKKTTFVEMLGSVSTLWAGMSVFVSQAMGSQEQHALILTNALLATPVYTALVITWKVDTPVTVTRGIIKKKESALISMSVLSPLPVVWGCA